jgi:hypothetical protein
MKIKIYFITETTGFMVFLHNAEKSLPLLFTSPWGIISLEIRSFPTQKMCIFAYSFSMRIPGKILFGGRTTR